MRRINLFDFVELGSAIRRAEGLGERSNVIDGYINTYELDTALKPLLSGDVVNFGVGLHYVRKLADAISELRSVFTNWRDTNNDGKEVPELEWILQHRFKTDLAEFKTILAAEARAAAIYSVAKVGIYSTNDLIENATAKFNNVSRGRLSEETSREFQEAAQCLAFGLHTACAFHMMRAVESTLLELMKLVCGRNFASLNANWGAYIAELDKIRQSRSRRKASQETIDLLRQMKDNHRNPVMHTELHLTMQEAMDIFDLGAVVISHLTGEIHSLRVQECKSVPANVA